MPGQILEKEANWEHDHRWKPVNTLKNSRLTIQIHCPDSGKRINVPANPATSTVDLQSYFDEAPVDTILGSTTLQELIKRVKKDIPALYLWDEVGGAVLVCGPHQVFQGEWETTMIWELICEEKAKSANGTIPTVMLDDGREAVVVTIGTPELIAQQKPSTVQRCLAKGNIYG
mmetsp:Transcript_4338/g.7730  ORF Transcript_4338/g.7730 Transcript_4338/m.7730 type:complete len:173 (-) Transcript_4338:160-678(-)|eukprot:CAMPEP_0201878530 /NCGR_PEP_ID=MMETSP0902-20130614/9664_1 /ASSEMBLY_ACC=CAM_ASM_000551 /TAXON_ID=420261 /ORGANISM="Thalassiosira antarctica, Strain CCMP982" /LENGTH=172 /DNA_ID=CAMNT_0048406189 /DNA_START=156 /DNA_END=674 /DNA_ORIENTATION=+